MTWIAVDATTSIDWIASQLVPVKGSSDPDWSGNRVNCCLPQGFDAYIKIFHEILEDLSVGNRHLTWDQTDDKSPDPDDRVRSILAGATLERSYPEDDFASKRVRWAELAKRYGLKFHPELNVSSFSRKFPGRSWPRYLVGPSEGSLTAEEFSNLMTHLCSRKSSEKVFMYWDLPMIVQGKDPYCIKGSFRTPPDDLWPKGTMFTPTYVWPEDHAWVVYSSYDLSFTLVAASRALAAELLTSVVLEAIKFPFDARIDGGSDTINI